MKKSIFLKMRNNFSYKIIITLSYFFLINFDSLAQNIDKNSFNSDLSKIEEFLNNIGDLSADFIQNSDGNQANGKFYLSRNKQNSGKMRIEYLSEPKVLIVVNKEVLSYYDVELDEISRISTNTTPASFLTRPNISFQAKDVEVTNIKKSPNEIKVSVVKKNRRDAGEFSLIFKLNPFEFVMMEVKNDLDQIISVELKNIDFNKKIPNKLYILNDNNNE